MVLYVARIGEMRNAYRTSVKRNQKENDYFGDIDVDGSVILKWILKNMV
jgi:hypothetical protein